MSKTYGVGIIGAGAIFRDHARAYAQLSSRAKMIGLADVDDSRARSATEQFFIPRHTTDYRELLARDDVDVVDICTPPCLHEEMVTAALEAGKYVVCEKPLAHTLAACDRIMQTADRFPGRLGTVHQLRYQPESQRTLWCRDNGLLGKLCFARFSRYAGLDATLKHKTWWGKWDVAGGGAVMTQCIHELDLMLLFMGAARRVTASMATLAHEIESEDTFSATIEFENGALASCFCTLASNLQYVVQWEVVGTQAAIEFPWKFNTQDRALARQAGQELARRFPTGPGRPTGLAGKLMRRVKRKLGRRAAASVPSQHAGYMRAVFDAIDSGSPLPVPPAEARRAVELCTGIYEAAILQKPVELPLDAGSRFYEGVTTEDYNGRERNRSGAVHAVPGA